MLPLIPLSAAVLPFILWPIEFFLPYPYLIEELAKGALVFPLTAYQRIRALKIAVLVGIIFAFSETVLYVFNIASVGQLSTLFTRLLFTIPLHVSTTVVILASTFLGRYYIVLGLAAAAIIHYFFNAALR